ncbi:MAG TPA: hypothetical protein VIT23_16170 [Terrimicrobiaceae bacterium]
MTTYPYGVHSSEALDLYERNHTMEIADTCCTLVPYFKIHEGKIADVKALCEQFIEKARTESKILHYGFSFDGYQVHCREGYEEAEGILAHLENVGTLLQETLKIADLTRLEIHGPEQEIAKLRGPLSDLKPQFFTLEYGFRRG